MLKIEFDGFNASALRHIGAAFTAMARDLDSLEGTKDCDVRIETGDGAVQGKVGFPTVYPASREAYEGPVRTTEFMPPSALGMNVIADPEMPADSFTMECGGSSVTLVNLGTSHWDSVVQAVNVAPPPPADPDANWPDPPQPELTATDHLDADGIPWDARIHAGTKTRLKASNTWKLKPGVDKALVDQVITELKGIQAVPVPPQMQATPINAAPPAPTLADAAAVSTALQTPPPPPPGPTTFAELIKEVTGRITAGQMTPDQVNGAVALVTNGQLTMCNQLAARQDLIPAVWSALCQATVG